MVMVTADLKNAGTIYLKTQCEIIKINHQKMVLRDETAHDSENKLTRRVATKKKAQARMKFCKTAG